MVDLLHRKLRPDGQYVFGIAPPNANLQEHYVLLEYFAPKIQPNTLLLPVFYDDLRETGVRPQLSGVFESSTATESLTATAIGKVLINESTANQTAADPASKLSRSTMDQSESAINDFLSGMWRYWEHRGTYRALLFIKMHHLRNTIFRVDPQSVRKMIPARYDRNMQALDAIVASCQEHEITLLLYIPPIRTDVPIPYDIAAYEDFKKMLRQYAANRGLMFADYEDVVATEEWGTKVSTAMGGGQELDFMHFTFPGHQKLASQIERTLRNEMPSLFQTVGETN